MATIIKSKQKFSDGRQWRVQIRKKGVYKSTRFFTKAEAQRWAFEQEEIIINNANNTIPDITFAQLIDKYVKEVSVTKRSYKNERYRLLKLVEHPISKIKLRDLTIDHFISWRQERLTQISIASVKRELNSIKAIFTHAIKEWRILKESPLKNMTSLPQTKSRSRRYTDLEIKGLIRESGFKWDESPKKTMARVGIAILFAIETAMRAGEIVDLTWENVNLEDRTAFLPITKNGYSRTIPLSTEALNLLRKLEEIKQEEKTVFQLTRGTLDGYFRKLKSKLFIQDLHFHDTRREALSRMAKKVDVMTLAKISGYRDLSILQNTYYAPDMKVVAKLLA
ncbi:TPA: site-specific integrase [Pasteurella multocida]|nr:site-specific integrase [Pasteurella multocida]